jgi:hypothetical protein
LRTTRLVTMVSAAGPGDGRGSGGGFQPAGAGEPGPVIADLGEDPCALDGAQAGEAGDDPGGIASAWHRGLSSADVSPG